MRRKIPESAMRRCGADKADKAWLSPQRAQLSNAKEYSEFPTQGFVQPSPIKEKSKVPCVSPAPHIPCPRHALTQLPAAHVIELRAEEQGGNDVDDGEDDPEGCVPFAKNLRGSPRREG